MCDLDKPLVTCTLRDFIEALSLSHDSKKEEQHIDARQNMLKGIKGIMTIFGCSDYTARKIRNSGTIDDAIYQLGARSFVVDAEKAKMLYNSNKPTF